MSNARRLNDSMGVYVANQVIKLMNQKGLLVKNADILILGVTFKENCPDTRNSKVNDIIKELAKPGLDPRESAQEFAFDDSIHSLEDIQAGMELPGIVTNITAFGAFVDIGVHENGLIHVSQLRSKTVKLHQHVKVSVIGVDYDRKRISLRLCD